MMPRITVLGTGYLGTTHAACLAELGFEVLGLDTDDTQVKALAGGSLPFHEPGLEELLRKGLDSGRLRFTTSYADAAEFGDVHFVCVGTPQRADSSAADLSHLEACVETLAPRLTRPCLVVGKSTVPVGTAALLAERLTRLAPVGAAAELAWNPEFLREGHAVADTVRPDRIVAGVISARAEALLREVYAQPLAAGVPFLVTDLPTAELVKGAANAFLATKVSFINAMAEMCEAAGADIVPLAEALAHDNRIGGRFLVPGLGFGGGCLPKDIRAFAATARELGVDSVGSWLGEVDAINLRRRVRMVDLALEMAGGSPDGLTVGVLGCSFKPQSDDIRDSPALDVAGTLHSLGARVTVYDPAAMDRARQVHPELDYASSMLDAAAGADVLLLLTEWREFIDADPEVLGLAVARRNIADGRGALDADRWRAAGWRYRALGRPA
ncbi:MAG TPA: UDP-glucose/GDP-mannose dehydrogenase family protein [Streptosporangiaceae bacterium]